MKSSHPKTAWRGSSPKTLGSTGYLLEDAPSHPLFSPLITVPNILENHRESLSLIRKQIRCCPNQSKVNHNPKLDPNKDAPNWDELVERWGEDTFLSIPPPPCATINVILESSQISGAYLGCRIWKNHLSFHQQEHPLSTAALIEFMDPSPKIWTTHWTHQWWSYNSYSRVLCFY